MKFLQNDANLKRDEKRDAAVTDGVINTSSIKTKTPKATKATRTPRTPRKTPNPTTPTTPTAPVAPITPIPKSTAINNDKNAADNVGQTKLKDSTSQMSPIAIMIM